MAKRRQITRREFVKAAGLGVVAAGVAPTIFIPRQARGASKELKILVWSHFVPRFDKEWYDGFAKKWGEANGVAVTVDHINLAEIPSRTAAEVAAGQGHDLIEWIQPTSQFEPSVLNMADVVQEAEKRFGKQHPLCRRTSYNPNTNYFYSFCPGWTIDPGCYRKSLWEKAGKGDGPVVWEDLIAYGGKIKKEQGIQLGIGLSQELDSNMAARALLWSYDTSIQDENENVVLNNPKTVEATAYMARLFKESMVPEVFAWTAVSNNQALIAGRASYILNSISAYRSAQKEVPEIAKDIYFTPALKGPRGTGFHSEHVIYGYIIPKYSKNVDSSKKFLLHLVENYDQAMYASELYNSPAFFDAPIPSGNRGYTAVKGAKKLRDLHNAWFSSDPFALPGEDKGKLAVLKDAEKWSTNIGYPGPANPAEGEVFATFVLPNMMANAARGMAPQTAVEQAELLTKTIFAKWRQKGLVGGKT
ncbi:MAG: transporter substrate-binding protein [Deltaproteobacteria bacterium]|jgi:multiple sugar transport system substrate-binding protein|nr:transporter substrate-binding protein [Deltaproteobacteria bacterium]MBP2677650.1 transporter substrate-binding protein [Deltaproteobacteria bacterium]